MERRDVLKGIVGVLGGSLVTSTAVFAEDCPCNNKRMKLYTNEDFYQEGKFQPNVAKQAFLEMFERFDYSLTETIRNEKTQDYATNFWIAEFNSNDFARVGMGGIFWVNDKEHDYFGHEIYLLPYQMIPEHYHVAAEGMPAKHESWQVRYGSIYNFGKGGELTDDLRKLLPQSQLDQNGITCFNAEELKVGDFRRLTALGDPHFMMAGPHGAIVTEYACWHSAEGLKFTNPNLANVSY